MDPVLFWDSFAFPQNEMNVFLSQGDYLPQNETGNDAER
jgi:hypothetical protein